MMGQWDLMLDCVSQYIGKVVQLIVCEDDVATTAGPPGSGSRSSCSQVDWQYEGCVDFIVTSVQGDLHPLGVQQWGSHCVHHFEF